LDLKAINDQKLVAKLMAALREVAQDTVTGIVCGWRREDRAGAQMYREAIAELVAAIDKK
jgi:hypothetical protein